MSSSFTVATPCTASTTSPTGPWKSCKTGWSLLSLVRTLDVLSLVLATTYSLAFATETSDI
jgi:hypothetical protein